MLLDFVKLELGIKKTLRQIPKKRLRRFGVGGPKSARGMKNAATIWFFVYTEMAESPGYEMKIHNYRRWFSRILSATILHFTESFETLKRRLTMTRIQCFVG